MGLSLSVKGQINKRQVTQQKLIWQTWNQSIEFNSKWSARFEFTAREFYDPYKLHQVAARMRISYALSKQWVTGGGFAVFFHHPNDPVSTSKLVVPEWRPHVEASYEHTTGRCSITHRYRIENRFMHNNLNEALVDGYSSTWRFRYRIGFDYLIINDTAKRPLKLRLTNELLINAGKNVQNNVFDNNRVTLSIHYSLPANFAIEVGYLHWFQQRSSGYQFFNRHIITFAIFHKLILNK